MRGGLCTQFTSFHSIDGEVPQVMAALMRLCLCKDCTSAVNPDGASGREWCFVEARKACFAIVLLLWN